MAYLLYCGMFNRNLIVAVLIAALCIYAVVWWRGRPLHQARRVLNRAAQVASVTTEDNEIKRRMKALALRDFVGYELHVDIEDLARDADLMQEDVVTAWLYAVGLNRYLTIEINGIELISADDERIAVRALADVDSNYERGVYSKVYPVEIELLKAERKLRVSSLKTSLQLPLEVIE